MLTQITIKDFATIENLQLQLSNATTMITGETGAGKSIFIEAIELVLGGRASHHSIRAGKEKANVSLCFDITHFPHVIALLQAHDLYLDSTECIIRRVITHDGRSRCYVNGTPVTLQMVKELGDLLFHLHGQHEQQILIKPEAQRDIVDRFADHLALVQQVKQAAEDIKNLTLQINLLREKTEERTERLDYLRFQLDELQSIQLKENEWETLESEHKRQSHHEELFTRISHLIQLINGDDEQNITTRLQEVRKTLDAIVHVETKTADWILTIESVRIHMSDLECELRDYIEKRELDPEKIRQIEERVSQIFNLARKHKVLPQNLCAYTQQLSDEYKALNTSDENLSQLEKQLQTLVEMYHQSAEKLSLSRKNAAKKLEKMITSTIRSLSLPHGEFKIHFEATSDISIHGQEKILFLIKTNPDQTLQPLAKVISGGELSRLSLALHLALANKTNIPTLIFDEVDTGLSGATAEKIGRLLRELGESYQVFCVTHQAQVAACGHQHLMVEKIIVDKITYTKMKMLSASEKTNEIARMLGGAKITKTTLAHAEEMLQEG